MEGAVEEIELAVDSRRRGPRRIDPSWLGNGYCDNGEDAAGEVSASEDDRIPEVVIVVAGFQQLTFPSRQSIRSVSAVCSLAGSQRPCPSVGSIS